MVIKFKGEVEYKDGERIEFEIDDADKMKVNIIGDLQYESEDHLMILNRAILKVKQLLETDSPKKFEMYEYVAP